MRYPIAMRLLFLWWAFFGASGPVVCQVVAKFHAEHAGVHYTTYLTVDRLASTPEWRDEDPNPPLDVRQAMTAASAGLKQLFDNADEWKLDLVTLKPMRDRWIYVVSFVAPLPSECKDCLSFPFILVVTMDGKALPAEISPATVQPAVVVEEN